MHEPADSLLILFCVIVAVPFIAKWIKLPIIVIEIIIGIILGYLGWIKPHPTLDFFASFGLTYLLFLAGLEVDFRFIRKHLKRTVGIAIASISMPFLAGFLVGKWLGIQPVLFGTIFCTTSLGVVLPMTKEFKEREQFVQILLGSVILVDILSMFLLAFSLSLEDGNLSATFIYSIFAVLTLFLIPWIINLNKVHEWVEKILSNKIYFEREVRFSFALIFILSAITESFGFHSIIGAFIAGLIIYEITPQASRVDEKLKGFGYGFFIPLFFILVGTRVDLIAVFQNADHIFSLVVVIAAAVVSKWISVCIVSKIEGLCLGESLAMGAMHTARLSLIIAAAEIARKIGIIDGNIFSTLVLLAVITSTLAPTISRWILHHTSSK
ncbi:MAG: cation:proton antiporter [Opitutales bacterium]|nr:cation:proton antiporter [Opitutales bacterium]